MGGKRGVRVGGSKIECIRFDDDLLLSKIKRAVNAVIAELNSACEEYGMSINRKNQTVW